jgi:DNA-binding beta-propeller fold protein YncE
MRSAPRPTLLLAVACLCVALAACSKEKVCASDQALCSDTCARLTTDPSNCGACGNACAQGQVCTASACVFGTAQNCGALGRTCGTGERCRDGDCVADLYLACFDTNEVREATSGLLEAGVPVATAAGPISMAWVGDALAVADSINGTVELLRLDPPAVRSAGTIIIPAGNVGFSDLEFVTAANGLLYVSNAAANVLDVLDPVGLRIADEIPLGGGFGSPQGILVLGTKAYVALNGSGEVVVVDVTGSGACASPPCGTVSKRIALPASLASASGAPMPARLALAAGKLYVTLWNLDPRTFSPAGSGRLAVIDTATDTLVTAAGSTPVDLGDSCLNPADIAAVGTILHVTCGYATFPPNVTITGSGILPVDVSSGTPVVGAVLPLPAYAPGALTFCGATGYAGDRASGAVLRYDPASRSITSTQTLCPPPSPGSAAYVAALACGT